MANLQAHYQQDASIDFSAIRDVCDAEQERAASVLLELQQRMIEKASEEPNETPPSQSDPVNAGSMASIESNTVDDQKNIPGRLPSRTDDVDRADRPKCISAPQPPEPLTPPATPHPTQAHSPAQSPRSRASADSGRIARRSGDPYRPVATTVTKTGLFGFGSRITVERTTNPPENPLVDEYLADTLKRNSKRLSGRLSATTVDPFADSLERPVRKVMATVVFFSSNYLQVFDEHNDSICFDSRMLASQSDHMISNSSPNSLDPTDLLPNELNNYAGFCKGAWRHQMGDTKRAMEERIRPGGMYKQAKFWQCKHCNFEGRSVPIDKKKNGHDMRVFKLISGVQFRWDFLFKTHFAKLKEHDLNPTNATFGCIFCCSKGKETPTFEGIESFMGHLGDHRERLPTGEVLYRMNCLVGRQASSTEDFDINFISAVD